ncbi:MAG: error-prone DNA polymerase [Verrucomicrobiota bacterium]
MFVELHANSAFSFHRGASHPEALVTHAAELNQPAIALADRDGVYGSARASFKGKETGVGAIVGAEITLNCGCAVPLLVESRVGYQNLCQMLTRAKLRAPKGEGSVSWNELAEFSDGLVCLSGDEDGPVRQALDRGDRKGAEIALERLTQIYGKDRTWVEIQRHRVRGENWIVNQLVDLARSRNQQLLATNGARYTRKAERPLMDAFTALRNYTTLDEAGALLAKNAENYLKSSAQMQALFADLPEAVTNTMRLAEQLEFRLENLGYEFPRSPTENGESMSEMLRRLAFEGAKARYGKKYCLAVSRQIEHELALINKLGFCGYFLIVWEITQFARNEGILAQGRGSAANSAVCYSLGITNVDPVGGELLFERFLSEGRKSWPDIDIDLPSGDRREAVIQHVYERFAPRGAAMTANVITYRGRSAMREMGKVLAIPEDVLGRYSDIYGRGHYPNSMELTEHLNQAGLPSEHPRLPALTHLYHLVYGLPRHLGQHSGGMIVSDRPLDRYVPLENASMSGRVVVQWDKDDCEDLGIIKVDLLGLGMLSAMQDTVEICSKRGRPVDLGNLPYDDPKVYDLLCAADTVGLFQVESRAQMATLPRLRPRCFYDIVIETALIRPGPIVGKMVHPYINRKRGREPIDYIDPIFEPVLKRTLGVPLFQEQVLKMAMVIADFTGSEAEELRRAMSFNRSQERMDRVMGKLRAAMDGKRVNPQLQERIIHSIQAFAQYGFPESHAISFGLIAFASAWLKVYRAAEFYVGLLNNQPMGFYSPATLIKDAKRRGIHVKSVNVQDSDVLTTVVSDSAIRLGLHQVKGLSRGGAERIECERKYAPFADLRDFQLRVRLDKDERRVLAKIGALNGLAEHRREALWQAELDLDPDDLFLGAAKPNARPSSMSLPPMNPVERLSADYAGLHLTTGPHPMAYLREQLQKEKIFRSDEIERANHGDEIVIAGLVICRQRPSTAKGHVFLSLEDEAGISNAFVPGETFEEFRPIVTQETFLKVRGHVQSNDNVVSIYTHHIEALRFDAVTNSFSYDFH